MFNRFYVEEVIDTQMHLNNLVGDAIEYRLASKNDNVQKVARQMAINLEKINMVVERTLERNRSGKVSKEAMRSFLGNLRNVCDYRHPLWDGVK